MNNQDLRDEEVLYADFSVEEIDLLSATSSTILKETPIIFSNPVKDRLYLNNLPNKITAVQLLSMDGKVILETNINSSTATTLDVS
ncbi:MAG: fibronectin type III, partial [Saprospiraceae bacterium]